MIMTGTTPIQEKKQGDFPSYRTRLSLIITLIFFIFIVGIAGIIYHFSISQVLYEFQDSRLQTEKTFVSSAILTEYGLESFDAQYDFLLKDRTSTFFEAYKSHRSNLSSLNLSALKRQMSAGVPGDIELYLVNSSGVVEYTTYKKDYLMDFSNYPDFFSSLTKIRQGNEFITDPWIRDFSNPRLYWKYGYLPTDDHEYILEIGLRNENYSRMHKEMVSDLRNVSGDALNVPDLIHVETYDKAFRNRTLRTQDEDQDLASVTGLFSPDELHSLLNQTFISKEPVLIKNPSKHQIISVQYIDLSQSRSASGAERSFIGILVFSTEGIEHTFFVYQAVFLVLTVISLLSGVLIARYLSAIISRPIEMMTEDVGIIASSSLNHSVRETGVYETEQLRESINQMITSIREYIEEIETQRESLRSELEMREKAENALVLVNKRLRQLSEITRHDILNQLTALQFFLDLISDSKGKPELSGYIENSLQVLENITMLLKYTLDYERIGQEDLVWQNVGSILDKSRHEFRGRISIRHSCENLDILVDPLITKVFYNLIDNSIRHGDNADSIEVFFEEQEESGVLVYTDNGVGILPEEKEKIFYRGFGKGSGLGMAFIREVLESDGMTIAEKGVVGQGVRFEIRIPKDHYRFSPHQNP